METAQIGRISARLRAALPGQLRMVVTHQPVHVATATDRKNQLHGWLQAVPAWAAAGADLVLGGHIHLPYVRRINESVPALSRNLWAVQAGTAVSSRIRGGIPNSVNVIRYEEKKGMRRCVIERCDFSAATGRFASVEASELELAPAEMQV